MATQTRMTAREFLNLPESLLPTELINGDVIMSPAPELRHQETIGRLYLLLRSIAPDGKLYFALVDVYLDEDNVLQPDLPSIAPGGTCVIVGGKRLHGAPDLVGEFLSAGTARQDR